jgi:hypothetical protein
MGGNPSTQVATWKFNASATARALAPKWAANTTVAAGDALLVVDTTSSPSPRLLLFVYPTGATTGTSAPTFTGTGTDGNKSDVVGYRLGGGASNGMAVTNEDPTSLVRGGDASVQSAAIGPNFGSEPVPMGDPSLYYVVSTNGGTSPVSVRAWL